MFTQEAMQAALIFAQTESHKGIYKLVGESSRGLSVTRWNMQKAQLDVTFTSESDIQ